MGGFYGNSFTVWDNKGALKNTPKEQFIKCYEYDQDLKDQ